MPAIQPSRLRQQAAALGNLFKQPARFRSGLRDLFEFYANRAHRIAQGAAVHTLLPFFEIPPAVIRQVENELDPLCQADPQASLELADCLWADPYLEVRRLAVYLLSQAPVTPTDLVKERLITWITPTLDKTLLDALLSQGAGRLRRSHPEDWWGIIKSWLANPEIKTQALGLRALAAMVPDEAFHSLPAVFTAISPFVYPPNILLQDELLDVLKSLAQRSPAETVYFLKQVLAMGPDPRVPRLVRRCLPYLKEVHQSSLRAALRVKARSDAAND